MTATHLSHGASTSAATGSQSLVRAGLMAGVMAALVNAMIFALAVAAGIFPSFTFTPDTGAQMSIEPVILVSMVGVLAGVGAFALLRRRFPRPYPLFLRIAAAVLLLSFAAPFAIPGTALLQATVLNAMHVVVAGLAVVAVRRVQRAE